MKCDTYSVISFATVGVYLQQMNIKVSQLIGNRKERISKISVLHIGVHISTHFM